MLGLSASIASTVVLIKNLADAGLADTGGVASRRDGSSWRT